MDMLDDFELEPGLEPEADVETDVEVSPDVGLSPDVDVEVEAEPDPEMDYITDEDEYELAEYVDDLETLSWEYHGLAPVSRVGWIVIYDGDNYKVFASEKLRKNVKKPASLKIFAVLFARVLKAKGVESFDDLTLLKGIGRKLTRLYTSKGTDSYLFLFIWREGDRLKSRYVPDSLIKGGSGRISSEQETLLAEVLADWLAEKIREKGKETDFLWRKMDFISNPKSFVSWIKNTIVPDVSIISKSRNFGRIWPKVLRRVVVLLEVD